MVGLSIFTGYHVFQLFQFFLLPLISLSVQRILLAFHAALLVQSHKSTFIPRERCYILSMIILIFLCFTFTHSSKNQHLIASPELGDSKHVMNTQHSDFLLFCSFDYSQVFWKAPILVKICFSLLSPCY